MTGVSIKVEGLDDLERKLRRYGREAEKVLDDSLEHAAIETRDRASRSIMKGPKTGAVYTDVFATINGKVVPVKSRADVPNLGAVHQASAPGQAPATDTGRLANSIAWAPVQGGYAVGTGEDYGRWLELGTSRILPRPWLQPAAQEAADNLPERIVAGLKRLRNRGR